MLLILFIAPACNPTSKRIYIFNAIQKKSLIQCLNLFQDTFAHLLIFKGQARNTIQYSLYIENTFHFCKVSEKEKVIKLKREESIENIGEPEET